MQIKTKIVSCHTADSKQVKQEVNGTVILPPLVFPGQKDRQEWMFLIKITLNCVYKSTSLVTRLSNDIRGLLNKTFLHCSSCLGSDFTSKNTLPRAAYFFRDKRTSCLKQMEKLQMEKVL